MQRFLPVAGARLQVLGAVMHDPQESAEVATALEHIQPEVILLDRSVDEWTGAPDAFQAVLLATVPGLQANALWKSVDAAARRLRMQVTLLHQRVPPPPPEGVKLLRRLLDKEGFDPSGDLKHDVGAFYQHYVLRCGPLRQWISSRRDASAARIRAAFEGRPSRGAAIIALPDMHDVCDRVQKMGRS